MPVFRHVPAPLFFFNFYVSCFCIIDTITILYIIFASSFSFLQESVILYTRRRRRARSTRSAAHAESFSDRTIRARKEEKRMN